MPPDAPEVALEESKAYAWATPDGTDRRSLVEAAPDMKQRCAGRVSSRKGGVNARIDIEEVGTSQVGVEETVVSSE
jgi:hypothetical protein